MSSNTSRSASSGGRRTSRGASTRGRQGGRGAYRKPQASTKFKGNCAELEGHIFDCLDYKQADAYVHTLKRVSEYVRATYKCGGDIHSSIINEAVVTIEAPNAPTFSVTLKIKSTK